MAVVIGSRLQSCSSGSNPKQIVYAFLIVIFEFYYVFIVGLRIEQKYKQIEAGIGSSEPDRIRKWKEQMYR